MNTAGCWKNSGAEQVEVRAGTRTRAAASLCAAETLPALENHGAADTEPKAVVGSAVLVSSGLSSGILALCWKVLSAHGS